MAGNLSAHRALPIDPIETAEPEAPMPAPIYSLADSQRAWARRRADLYDLAGVDDLLDEVDARGQRNWNDEQQQSW